MPGRPAKSSERPSAERLLAERLLAKRICICVGSGGVGKTTASAALALGLASRGQKVAVVTIDPANRLATALGLSELDNEPQLVAPELFAAQQLDMRGELWAMMLDAKGTFDGLIGKLAPDERTREEILSNRIYKEISSAVAGSQEFTAIAKLYELDRDGQFDVIVLDTPPSRNALDFLDAPARLLNFFEGRALKVFLAPSGLAARVVGRGTSLVFSMFMRVTGVDLLGDLSVFFGSLAGLVDGFRERARGVESLLRDPGSAFLLITSPEREPVREAIFFAEKLAEAGMPLGGLIVNRVHSDGLGSHSTAEVHALIADELGERLAGKVAGNLADFDVLVNRDRESIAHLSATLEHPHPVLVPHLDGDVQDLAGLAEIAEHLLG
ncbi:MAG TPA: ArsA-related P-loop ATPase [Solirubrobacteraceae bacterium]|nr:ArsA-related P-loop ATPase [Solirubrobacteraceae bacterium]